MCRPCEEAEADVLAAAHVGAIELHHTGRLLPRVRAAAARAQAVEHGDVHTRRRRGARALLVTRAEPEVVSLQQRLARCGRGRGFPT